MAVESYQVTPEHHEAAKAGTEPYVPGEEQSSTEESGIEQASAPEETPEAPAEQTPEQAAEDAQKTAESLGLDYGKLYQEFTEKGELGEQSVKAIKDALPGLPDEVLATYLSGLKALQAQAEQAAFQLVGGQEQYQTLVQWGAENLSEGEIAEYNAALDRGGDAAKFAIQGLHARMQGKSTAPRPSEPSLVHQGQRTAGEPLIKSRREFVDKYIRDPRWEKDAAFRANAEELLNRSMQSPDYRKY